MQLTQAILPLAGLGTRFLPWTKSVAKEMLPIGTKPIVALLVDECLSIGITDICFVISEGKEIIPQFFAKDAVFEAELERRGKTHLLEELARYDAVRFHTVYQHEQKGDGHAILQAKDWVTSENIAVLFGDDLIIGEKTGLEQMSDVRHQMSDVSEAAVLCLQNVPKEKVSSYGIADVKESEGRIRTIRGLVEKPKPEDAPSTLGIVGKYILPRSIFDVLPDVGSSHGGPTASASGGLRGASEIRIIDALIAQLGTLPIYGCVFEGTRYDTGTPEGYREAVMGLGCGIKF